MTQDLFRHDAYLRECDATVAARSTSTASCSTAPCSIRWAAARPATAACWCWPTAASCAIADTRKAKDAEGQPTDDICHLPAPGQDALLAALQPGDARDGPHRLGAPPPADALPHHHPPAVPPGAAAGERLLDHARLRAAGLQHDRPAGQGSAHRTASRAWWRPAIRWRSAPSPTRSWTPTRRWSRACRCSRRAAPAASAPSASAASDQIDFQPCGGTHVANTAEIGAVVVTKIEKKSATTRRVVLGFA